MKPSTRSAHVAGALLALGMLAFQFLFWRAEQTAGPYDRPRFFAPRLVAVALALAGWLAVQPDPVARAAVYRTLVILGVWGGGGDLLAYRLRAAQDHTDMRELRG